MSDQLSGPAGRAVDAVNAGDTDVFLALFTADGWIDDNGRVFRGRDAMREWSDRELIGAHTRFDVTGSAAAPEGVAIDIDVTSDGFNGYSRFVFAVQGDSLQSMTIAA